jgi:hypothetical protein
MTVPMHLTVYAHVAGLISVGLWLAGEWGLL